MSDIFHWPLSNGQEVCDYADHARIVAEATAEARAAERRHWEARFRNAEQAHAAALAAVERLPGHTAHAYIETSDWPCVIRLEDLVAVLREAGYGE